MTLRALLSLFNLLSRRAFFLSLANVKPLIPLAALDAYLSGLRNRAYPLGINVITVKPGFVRTRLTEGKVNPKSPLLASPEKVAGDIFNAVRSGRSICYTPWFWSYIMCIIRSIPEFIFKRLKL